MQVICPSQSLLPQKSNLQQTHAHTDTHGYLGALLSYFQAVVSDDAEERNDRVENS